MTVKWCPIRDDVCLEVKCVWWGNGTCAMCSMKDGIEEISSSLVDIERVLGYLEMEKRFMQITTRGRKLKLPLTKGHVAQVVTQKLYPNVEI
jgi:hypothetical protein